MVHDWKKFNNQEFLDFNKINWDEKLKINENNVNVSFNNYLDTINTLITKHASIKNLNKKLRKFPLLFIQIFNGVWLTRAIQNSIQRKNRLFKKFTKYKNANTKT